MRDTTKKKFLHPLEALAKSLNRPIEEMEIYSGTVGNSDTGILTTFLDNFEYTISGKKHKVPVFIKTKISKSPTLPHMVNVAMRDPVDTSSS